MMQFRCGSQRRRRLLLQILFCISISLLLIQGSSRTPPAKQDEVKPKSNSTSTRKTVLEVLFICLGVVALVVLSVFLFKMWQKKKREEHHARMLKLFEEDDELEVELGLRD